jgi:hypothetical protein
VENVRPVLVNVNTLDIFAVYVPAQMAALVNDKTRLTRPLGEVGKCGSEQSGPYNKIVVMLHDA